MHNEFELVVHLHPYYVAKDSEYYVVLRPFYNGVSRIDSLYPCNDKGLSHAQSRCMWLHHNDTHV
jgi:hypothetical protein